MRTVDFDGFQMKIVIVITHKHTVRIEHLHRKCWNYISFVTEALATCVCVRIGPALVASCKRTFTFYVNFEWIAIDGQFIRFDDIVVDATRKLHKIANRAATDRRDGLYHTLTVSLPLTDNTFKTYAITMTPSCTLTSAIAPHTLLLTRSLTTQSQHTIMTLSSEKF